MIVIRAEVFYDAFNAAFQRVTKAGASSACAAVGVLLVVMAALLYSEVALFAGLGLLAVSHVLTPCLDRIAVWRRRLLK